MKHPWLKDATWSVVTEINRQLCAPKAAQHGRTSDGHTAAQRLWDATHRRALDLRQVAELCHECHRLAPFLNYNGNTFVAVARQTVAQLTLPAAQAALLRSIIGHIVAGTAEPPEHAKFLQLVQNLGANDGA